ncbi:hypothetical protein [Streptacidiphilus sp. MAP12-16]|uniref:hypothetical protein n=1 Tax=Streptacidiphilus sp. MAP12-16 TaxID=3156300 RepID=UPI0035113833
MNQLISSARPGRARCASIAAVVVATVAFLPGCGAPHRPSDDVHAAPPTPSVASADPVGGYLIYVHGGIRYALDDQWWEADMPEAALLAEGAHDDLRGARMILLDPTHLRFQAGVGPNVDFHPYPGMPPGYGQSH